MDSLYGTKQRHFAIMEMMFETKFFCSQYSSPFITLTATVFLLADS
jgi:hypothetical protein